MAEWSTFSLAFFTSLVLFQFSVYKDKQVDLISLKESIDTTTPQGRFVLTIFGALSELERETTLQRQKEGIAAARLNGKNLGRPKAEKPKDWDRVYTLWKKGDITVAQAIEMLEMSRTTFYRRVKECDNYFFCINNN